MSDRIDTLCHSVTEPGAKSGASDKMATTATTAATAANCLNFEQKRISQRKGDIFISTSLPLSHSLTLTIAHTH